MKVFRWSASTDCHRTHLDFKTRDFDLWWICFALDVSVQAQVLNLLQDSTGWIWFELYLYFAWFICGEIYFGSGHGDESWWVGWNSQFGWFVPSTTWIYQTFAQWNSAWMGGCCLIIKTLNHHFIRNSKGSLLSLIRAFLFNFKLLFPKGYVAHFHHARRVDQAFIKTNGFTTIVIDVGQFLFRLLNACWLLPSSSRRCWRR